MIDAGANWRTLGDVPWETWRDTITRAGGPEGLASADAWAMTRPHSALALAMLRMESSYGTDFDANPATNFNSWNLKLPDGGGYVAANGWADGAHRWRERLTSRDYKGGVYFRTVSIADLIHVYAPLSENATEHYIDTVVDLVNGYLDPTGIPNPSNSRGLEEEQTPMALSIRQTFIPAGNRNRPGTKLTQAPLWITVHETANTGIGADAEMHRRFTHHGGGPESVSFHFCVDDAEAVQLLPLDEIGWHAGDGCDSRPQDIGCYQSVAIETCVNVDGNWAKTLDNLEALMAAIIQGDVRIGFAGRTGQFSPERIAQHNRWSGKNCPAKIRALGIWGQEIEQTKALLTTTPPPVTPPVTPPEPDVLPGLDLGVVRRLFGTVTGEDGKNYQFDPDGPVSRLWLDRAKADGVWPKLQEVWSYDAGARRYFRFEDGSLVLSPSGQAPRWLRAA